MALEPGKFLGQALPHLRDGGSSGNSRLSSARPLARAASQTVLSSIRFIGDSFAVLELRRQSFSRCAMWPSSGISSFSIASRQASGDPAARPRFCRRDSRQRPAQKRRRSDLLIGKIAEQFAEALQFLVEHSADRLDRRVARSDSGAAVDDDSVEVLQIVEQGLADARRDRRAAPRSTPHDGPRRSAGRG